MRTVRRILVTIKDPLAKSLPAVTKATQLAQAWGAQIELFHGLDTPLYIDTEGTVEDGFRGMQRQIRARRLTQLEAIAARVRKRGIHVTTAAEWDFPVYESIVRRASHIGADLIVAECGMGRRVAPMLLRLTDWELLRLSPVPVLVVKGKRPYHHPTILAAVDPRHTHAKSARLDEDILRAGASVQQALRGRLLAVHACPTAFVPSGDLIGGDLPLRVQRQVKAAAQKSFDGALRGAAIPPARRYLLERSPRRAILDTVRATRSALVVMGAVSRSGLKRIFIGNTAEKVLDELPCDVLVIKPRGFASRVPRAKRGARLLVPLSLSPL